MFSRFRVHLNPNTPPAAPAPAPAPAEPAPAATPPVPAAPAPAPAPAAAAPAAVPIPVPAPAPAPAPAPVPAPAPAAPAAAPAGQTLEERFALVETQLAQERRARIVAEMGINAAATEFITATDEAGMRAQAERLKGFAPAAPVATPPPPAAGSPSAPAPAPAQTLQEQIAAAEKGSNKTASLALKLQAMRGG